MRDKDGKKRHIIGMLVENKTGVLARIAGLIASKGYNIESLSVGETLDPTVSRMTIVVRGDDWVIEQAVKQLNRLIDVVKVSELTDEDIVERELILIRVNAEPAFRAEVLRIADIFRAKVVDVTPMTYTLELTGDEDKLDAFTELLKPYGIQEVVRTGKVVMLRGSKAITKRYQEKLKQAAGKEMTAISQREEGNGQDLLR